MSVGAASLVPRRRIAWPVARLASARVPLGAFLVSRLLVLATGAAGVLTMAAHNAAGAAVLRTDLGPVGSVLAGSVDRFDAFFYLDISVHGFGAAPLGRLAFFPLYPALIHVLTPVTGHTELAGFLISAGALLVALVLLHRLTELELGRRAADATVLLLAFAPLSFFFTAVYTEALFLALSVGSLYAARTGRWRTACGIAALATLTRPTGILIGVALTALRWRERGGPERSLAWVLALPAALGGYMAWLAASGYGWLAAFHAQSGWQRSLTGPLLGGLEGLWAGIRGLAHLAAGEAIYRPTLQGPFTQDAESVVLAVVLVAMGVTTVACLRRLPRAYGLYALAVLLLCVSSPEAGQPLWSLDRFALTLFPLWMVAGEWIARRRLLRPALVLSTAALVFSTLQFSAWAFVA